MSGRPIRVLVVVPDLRVGGAERHVATLLPRMDPARFTPSVVCIGEEGVLFADLPAAGVEARALHLVKRQAVRALYELVAVIRRARPDVAVVRGYNAETLGRIAARVAGVEHTIMFVHNIGDAEPRSGVRTTVDRALTRFTSGYFGVAEAQRRYLVDELGYPEIKIRIIHNGVDLALFDVNTDRGVFAEFGFSEGDPVVGILAALRPEKDHATLLRAARIVINDAPSEVPRYRRRCDSSPTRGAVLRTTDHTERPLRRRAWRRRSITLRERCFRAELDNGMFPIALLGAMACAQLAVCTAAGGIPEIINHGECGYLVPPKDLQQLAARLVSLLSNPQTARRIGWARRDRVEAEFDLDRSVGAARQAIEDVKVYRVDGIIG